ncbi:MAG: tetratricopeptide repeat protein [Thermoguttaceae bacterium]
MKPTELKTDVYFFGKLAGATRHEAARLARGAGYRVATTLHEGVGLVVLGEGADLAQTRVALAQTFDEKSRHAFESGALRVVSESQFLARLVQFDEPLGLVREKSQGATPAAVASLVGVPVATVRRWLRKGLLSPVDPRARLPILSSDAIVVARRLAFLVSGLLSEDVVERKILAFAELLAIREAPETDSDSDGAFPLFDAASDAQPTPLPNALLAPNAPRPDLARVILQLTLSADGRDVLLLPDATDAETVSAAPIDAKGQRVFDFAAIPADGALDTPVVPAKLSPDEEQIDLAERLAQWNARTTGETGRPGFLSLFEDAPDDEFATPTVDVGSLPVPEAVPEPESAPAPTTPPQPLERPLRVETLSFPRPSDDFARRAKEEWLRAGIMRQVTLCTEAATLEKEGYWEEAARVYRQAALAGGADAGLNYRLGRVLFMLGEYGGARERFSAALELDPEFRDARIELGRAHAALRDDEDAIEAFSVALDSRPDDPIARVEIGKLYLKQGKREAAASEFRRAAEKIDDRQLANDVRSLIVTLDARSAASDANAFPPSF